MLQEKTILSERRLCRNPASYPTNDITRHDPEQQQSPRARACGIPSIMLSRHGRAQPDPSCDIARISSRYDNAFARQGVAIAPSSAQPDGEGPVPHSPATLSIRMHQWSRRSSEHCRVKGLIRRNQARLRVYLATLVISQSMTSD